MATQQAKKTLKQVIAEEYVKCSKDPVHFMRKYCMIQHPVRGKIPFHLYPFQEKTLNEFKKNRFNIVLKSRQTGISTLTAGFALWKMIFNTDFNVIVVATKLDVAKNLITKLRTMHEFLPSWLKVQAVEDTKTSIRLINGSQAKSIASSPDAGRSEALSLLVFDEAAFIYDIDEIWKSAQSALSTGGSCIALSTPNGVGNWFHKTWVGAEQESNPFIPIRLHWSVHPERDQRWRDEQTKLLGVKGAAQECLGGEQLITIQCDDDSEKNLTLKELYDFNDTNRYKILTPDGFKSFSGIKKLVKDEYLRIKLSNAKTIECSLNHVFIQNSKEIFAENLKVFDTIDSTGDDLIYIIDIEYYNSPIELFDITDVSDGNLFIVDGIISHNCDTDFLSSGNTVIETEILMHYKANVVKEPLLKTGIDANYWKWEYPNYTKNYMVVADVSRGDSSDYSAFHVMDIESVTQVAEYRGKMDTKDFGNFLVSVATEYNDALLVIENANIGWACIQQVIDRGYKNLFYMSKDLKYVDVEHQMSNRYNRGDSSLTAGFSTTSKTRPLIISKLDDYLKEKAVTINSIRLIDELFTFTYNNGRAEALRGYNDDLVMAFSIGLWVRDTALRLRQEGIDLTRRTLSGINIQTYSGVYGIGSDTNDPWSMNIGGEIEDLRRWL
jgi:hypothetical protein